jgi:hypothetical protein
MDLEIKTKLRRLGKLCAATGSIFLIFYFLIPVFASPPASPYNPGETLNPTCAPGDTNCRVYPSLPTTLSAATNILQNNHPLNFLGGSLYDNDSYLMQLSRYIHLNPVDLAEPDWQERGLKNQKAVREFLKKYKWSSYLDYIGIQNYSSLSNRDLILKMSGGENEYEKSTSAALLGDFHAVKDYIIEQ